MDVYSQIPTRAQYSGGVNTVIQTPPKPTTPYLQASVALVKEIDRLCGIVDNLNARLGMVLSQVPNDPPSINNACVGSSEVVTQTTNARNRIAQVCELLNTLADRIEV